MFSNRESLCYSAPAVLGDRAQLLVRPPSQACSELPAISCSVLLGCAHHQKSSQVAMACPLLQKPSVDWGGGGQSPGPQGAPSSIALGGQGRPPMDHRMWSVAPTKSEQRACLHWQPARTNMPQMLWPDHAGAQLRAQHSGKLPVSACPNQLLPDQAEQSYSQSPSWQLHTPCGDWGPKAAHALAMSH